VPVAAGLLRRAVNRRQGWRYRPWSGHAPCRLASASGAVPTGWWSPRRS